MDAAEQVPLIGKGGWRGTVARQPVHHGGAAYAVVQLGNSGPVLVPVEMLHRTGDGTYTLEMTQEELLRDSRPVSPTQETAPAGVIAGGGERRAAPDAELVVPVVTEEVNVGKREWETGGVRINVAVREREEVVDQPLVREEVRVERVPINRVVEGPPPVRQEGETLILPVVEEVLVVEKRLVLKEEVRVSKRRFEAHEPQRVVLRSEEPQIERVQPEGTAGPERNAA